ncbi:MAG: hypothetical protein M3R51_01435 [Candidatus Eremiobacteraeota bacterium]|nr:hypothetical protein [Candidatus Eremiobacteraeota bacterium]
MMQQRHNVLAIALAMFVALLPASADSLSLGITVTPGKFEVSIPLGTTYNVPVSVANTSISPTHIQATMVDFGLTQGGDYRFDRAGTRPYSLLKWASIRPREFDIAQGTSSQVQLTIAIPSDQRLSGEYAGIVFFQTRPERRAGAGVAFSARVASKIYETIPGTLKIEGAIEKMTSSASSDGRLYRVFFQNTGNAHVYLRGQIIIEKAGNVVYQVAMPGNLLVERGGGRTVEVHGKSLDPGSYQAIATVDYGGKTETGGEINFDVR